MLTTLWKGLKCPGQQLCTQTTHFSLWLEIRYALLFLLQTLFIIRGIEGGHTKANQTDCVFIRFKTDIPANPDFQPRAGLHLPLDNWLNKSFTDIVY